MNDDRPPVEAEHAPVPKYLIASFVVGLIVWAVYLAYGAATGGHNVWRGVVVLICFMLFLGWFWGLQRLYARRNRHQ
jgi:uncharacterized membrane protein YdjX (TVP38/TMEM64 family)